MSLIGKTVLVTGSSRGIGLEIAKAFYLKGAIVIIASRHGAGAVADALDPSGERVLGLDMDVTNQDQVRRGIGKIVRIFGSLDVLVSNAGNQMLESIDKMHFSDWRQIVGVHLDGAFLVTKYALMQMYKAKRGGSVIYIGSVHSKEASILKGPYVAAKHGVVGLAKVVAKEGAKHKVRANVICPGYVNTSLVKKQIPEQAKALGVPASSIVKNVFLKNTVDNEFTTTDEVAQTAIFLATFPTMALTGQSIIVSHGWHMD